MNDDKYISGLSKKKSARIMAWIGIIVIVALVIATLVTGITGSKYFMGCLWLCIIVPILIYVFLWIGKVLFSLNSNDELEDTKQADSEKENIEKE